MWRLTRRRAENIDPSVGQRFRSRLAYSQQRRYVGTGSLYCRPNLPSTAKFAISAVALIAFPVFPLRLAV